jgi:predicted  nucleic acid-binding Zn-ribbon protein
MTDTQQIDLGPVPAPAPAPKKTSGYRRLQRRHGELVHAHEALKAELAERDEREAELQASIDRLLEQHKRIMQTVRAPQPSAQANWFEGASLTLAQMAQNPDAQAVKILEQALVGLLQKTIALGARIP